MGQRDRPRLAEVRSLRIYPTSRWRRSHDRESTKARERIANPAYAAEIARGGSRPPSSRGIWVIEQHPRDPRDPRKHKFTETSESTRIPRSLPAGLARFVPSRVPPDFPLSVAPSFLRYSSPLAGLLALLLSVSSSSSSSPFLSSLLPLAKMQRRGLPVADDQRGFPFSTPCCCCCAAATIVPPPSSSLPSSSLFSRALGSTRMIILREEIRRDLRVERLRGVDARARGYRVDERVEYAWAYPRARRTRRAVESPVIVSS